jgi:uncharacterized protein YndB with AHSA1/START domain
VDGRADGLLVDACRRAVGAVATQADDTDHTGHADHLVTEAPIVRVQRVMPAPPAVVFDEWLDPEAMKEWMCPRPVRCVAVVIEPRVGGSVRIDVDDSGTSVLIAGRFLAIDRPCALRLTWSNSNWADPTAVSVVDVVFEPFGDQQTLMSIEHSLLTAGEFDDRRPTRGGAERARLGQHLRRRRQHGITRRRHHVGIGAVGSHHVVGRSLRGRRRVTRRELHLRRHRPRKGVAVAGVGAGVRGQPERAPSHDEADGDLGGDARGRSDGKRVLGCDHPGNRSA